MKIDPSKCPFRLDAKLVQILEGEMDKANTPDGAPVVLNFRDPSYKAESGGFMPVEIRVTAAGSLVYVTDFIYVGQSPFAELCKQLDFDFGLRTFQMMGREFPMEEGRDLFGLWQSNFIEYYRMGVYEVSVEAER